MIYVRSDDWRSALFTASSFGAAFVTLLFGLLDALDSSRGYMLELSAGALCGSAFVASLSAAHTFCPTADD